MFTTRFPVFRVLFAVLAQAFAEPATAGSTTASATPRQRVWLDASITERVLLAEELGEEGGLAFAKSKGWKPVYDGTSWSMVHGLDQVHDAS